MTPAPPLQGQAATNRRFIRVFLWSTLAAFGGAIVYTLFAILTGLEASLIGIPIGLAVGQATYYASSKRGGRRFQVLAVLLAFAAFALTYAPGMAAIAFNHGITVPAILFFAFMWVISPFIDTQSGFLGQFMVLAGMYVAWTAAATRKRAPK